MVIRSGALSRVEAQPLSQRGPQLGGSGYLLYLYTCCTLYSVLSSVTEGGTDLSVLLDIDRARISMFPHTILDLAVQIS
jgi:hypothetical protein